MASSLTPSIPRRRPTPPSAPIETPVVSPPRAFAYKPRVAPAAPAFTPSEQQKTFFDWVLDGTGNALLEAVAGAGKTTTLVRALGMMDGSIFFGAYNKKISDEIKVKFKELNVAANVYINTFHGYGLTNWARMNKGVEVKDTKVARIIDKLAEENPEYEGNRIFITKMVSFGKQFLIGCKGKTALDNLDAWTRLALHFSVDQDLPEDAKIEDVLAFVIEVYRRSAAQCPKVIDFDDMIFAPIYFNIRLFQNDWVLLDECQDVNPARRELAKRMVRPGGRFVAVGDSCQAIYGFTGAGGDSVERIIEEFKCVRLPLTVTYRCPKAVVEYVHKWVSHIQAHPDAPQGIVRGPNLAPVVAGAPVQPWFLQDAPAITDVILCRYTKPLIATAFAMIRAGVACKVEGRDIGNNLIVLATRWKMTSIDALEKRLDLWLSKEITKARAAKNERLEQDTIDRVETLKIFIERARAKSLRLIADLVLEIRSMFDDNVCGVVTLSTIHKGKGREWPRVFWIQAAIKARDLKDWELQQEVNINYVAGTRAMSELVLIPEGQL